MNNSDISQIHAVTTEIWQVWSKAVADKWAGDKKVIDAVEKDPKAYIQSQSDTKLDLSGINIKTADSYGSDFNIDNDGNWSLTLPWPSKKPPQLQHFTNMMTMATPPPGGGGSTGSTPSSPAACCCCSIFCCCCC